MKESNIVVVDDDFKENMNSATLDAYSEIITAVVNSYNINLINEKNNIRMKSKAVENILFDAENLVCQVNKKTKAKTRVYPTNKKIVGGKMEKVNDKNIDKFVQKNNKVILDCWAEWCNPCKKIEPMIEELNEEHKDIEFGKVNVEKNNGIRSTYSVMSLPTLLFFKNGQIIEKMNGSFNNKRVLERKIENIFGEI